MLKGIDLNKLRAFQRVFERRNLSLAARDLAVTPSAVSQNLKTLEKGIRLSLFTRAGKRLVPTPAGRRLYEQVIPLFHRIDTCVTELQEEQQQLSGTLRVGSVAEFGAGPLLRAVHQCRREHPLLQFVISLQDTRLLLERVARNELDFAICDGGPHEHSMRLLGFRQLAEEELVLAASRPFYQQHVAGDHAYQRLIRLPHLPYNEDREAVYKWYRHHFGKTPRLISPVRIDHARGVTEAIRLGLGLGVVPRPLVATEVAAKQMAVITTRRKPLLNRLLVVQLKDHFGSAAERFFLRALERLTAGQ